MHACGKAIFVSSAFVRRSADSLSNFMLVQFLIKGVENRLNVVHVRV